MSSDVDVPPRNPRRRTVALVVACTTLVHAWILGLEFQLDDYSILTHAAQALGVPGVPQVDVLDSIRGGYLFRPASWAIWLAALRASGGHADPRVFHAVVLVTHALSVWLLYRLMKPATSGRAALVGGAIFGLAPGGVQALSWTAGNGDQFAVLFAIAAGLFLRRYRRQGGAIAITGIAVCTMLAVLAKESAIALAPLVLLCWWTDRTPVPASRLVKPVVAATVAVVLTFVIRFAAMHRLLPRYAFDAQMDASRVAIAWIPFAQWLLPWNQHPETAELAPVLMRIAERLLGSDAWTVSLWIPGVCLTTPIVLACAFARKRLPAAMLALVIGVVIALLPAIAIWWQGPSADNSQSRLLYPIGTVAGVALAMAYHALSTHPRSHHIATIATVLLIAIGLDCEVSIARAELRAATMIRDRVDSLRSFAAQTAPDAGFVAVDGQAGWCGISLLGVGAGRGLGPPFWHGTQAVYPWSSRSDLKSCEALSTHPGPVWILEVRSGRFTRVGEAIDAGPSRRPVLQPAGPGRFTSDPPVTSRVVAVLRVTGRPRDPASPLVCTWKTERREFRTPLSLALDGDDTVYIAASPENADPGDLTWLMAGRVIGIDISNFETDGPPRLLEAAPPIEIVSPRPGSQVEAWSTPTVHFRSALRTALFRFTFTVLLDEATKVSMAYLVPSQDLPPDPGGVMRFSPAPGMKMEWPDGASHVSWQDAGRLFDVMFERHGMHEVKMSLSIEGQGSEGANTLCRSKPCNLTLVRGRGP